jgi:hypothetical protein
MRGFVRSGPSGPEEVAELEMMLVERGCTPRSSWRTCGSR